MPAQSFDRLLEYCRVPGDGDHQVDWVVDGYHVADQVGLRLERAQHALANTANETCEVQKTRALAQYGPPHLNAIIEETQAGSRKAASEPDKAAKKARAK